MRSLHQVKEALHGKLIPAVPVPRYAGGKLHVHAGSAYANYLCRQNIGGVAVWAHTGRGLHLTRGQRTEVMDIWKQELDGGKLLIAGVGALPRPDLTGQARLDRWKEDSLVMAQDAIHGGADALLVFPPVILLEHPPEQREAEIAQYHLELARLDCALIIFYLYEEAGGISYSLSLLQELLSISQAVGIKIASLDSVMTMQEISTLVTGHFPDKILITGEDRMFGYSLMRGAQSALVGLGAAYPNIQSDLIQASIHRIPEKWIDLTLRIDRYAEGTFITPMDKYILRMLWMLVLAGVIPEEAAHDPAGYVMTKEEVKGLSQLIVTSKLY